MIIELQIGYLSMQFIDKTAVDEVCLTLTTSVWGLLGACFSYSIDDA